MSVTIMPFAPRAASLSMIVFSSFFSTIDLMATHPLRLSGEIVGASIPGVITQVCVKVGAAVSAGDTVVKLEAMKMENDISTPVGGTVQESAVSEGTEVSDGQLLAVIG